jgi:hypothetical protein
VATGAGTTVAYSTDGLNWYTGQSTSIFTTGYGVASNPRIGATVVDSQLSLYTSGNGLNNKLDVISDPYFHNSYKEFTANITSHNF